MVRTACGVDFHGMPLEVRWRVNREKKEFAWTMMLMQPEYVSLDRMITAAGKLGYAVPCRSAHDVYLNDVRKTKPENLQSVMRLPVIKRNTSA